MLPKRILDRDGRNRVGEGIDGLVHISDISWTEQIKHPSEKFEKGDQVEAVVLKIDKENEKFSLGIKQLQPNPWEDIQKQYAIGSEVTGPITNVTEFGVFVKLDHGIDGLVYSSELAAERVENPEEQFSAGQEVTALVTKVDPVEQKISLSIRAVDDKAERAALKKVAAQEKELAAAQEQAEASATSGEITTVTPSSTMAGRANMLVFPDPVGPVTRTIP